MLFTAPHARDLVPRQAVVPAQGAPVVAPAAFSFDISVHAVNVIDVSTSILPASAYNETKVYLKFRS